MRNRLMPAALIIAALATAVVAGCDAPPGHTSDPVGVTAAEAGATPGDIISFSGSTSDAGPAFGGVGAISGGGGNSRLLIDYETHHRAQAQQILDYLFKPDYGASLQILKIEIGGDANATDGSEPSYQHAPGKIDCGAGYELWLARQAQRLNPALQIFALQWNAPHWVGGASMNPWTPADIRYVIGWLNCARSQGVRVTGVGGWNEHLGHGVTIAVVNWFIALRTALDRAGYRDVRIVGVDSYGKQGNLHGPDVATLMAAHRRFAAAVGIIGYHNVCGHLSRPNHCRVPPAAPTSGKPIWETELGALHPPGGLGSLARSINNAYIEAHVTGLLEWPMLAAMPADLPAEDLGLIRADQPWSGNFKVSALTWAIAQTTQFTQPGWHYLLSACRALVAGGSSVGYEAPNRSAWSLVVQTSDATAPQTIAVQVQRGLPDSAVHVWSTKLNAASPGGWFTQQASIKPRSRVFTYRVSPGFIYTFTTTTGQARGGGPAAPGWAPLPVSYRSAADQSEQPWGLAAMDGAFEYLPGSSAVFAQTALGVPDFWTRPRPTQPARYPYAVIGGPNWRNYTVAVRVRFTGAGQSAGLIARYSRNSFRPPVDMFSGYEFTVTTSGAWQLTRVRVRGRPNVLAAGRVRALGTSRWHRLTFAAHGQLLVAWIDSRRVVSTIGTPYPFGLAGIRTGGWYRVLFQKLTVTR